MKNQSKVRFFEKLNYPILIISIALLLIGVIAFNFVTGKPLAYAASLKTYISDVKILRCDMNNFDEESRKLKKEGYTIDTKYNFEEQDSQNEDIYADMDKPRAYLAYKTTKDYRNAITDLAYMNMKGPYSFADYEKLQIEQKKVALQLSQKLSSGVSLFRTNYKAKVPGAQFAYKMLNYFKEDDSGELMGDFLLKTDLKNNKFYETVIKDMEEGKDVETALNTDKLYKVCLQMDGVIRDIVTNSIAIACATIAGEADDWMTKLMKMTDQDIYDQDIIENEPGAMILFNTIAGTYRDYDQYKKFLTAVEGKYGDEWFDESDPEEMAEYDELVKEYYKDTERFHNVESIYEILGSIPYCDDKVTNGYSPYGKFDEPYTGNGALINLFLNIEEELVFEDFYPMASVFTEAQLDMIYIAGIETFITSCSNTEKTWTDLQNDINKSIKYDYENPNAVAPVVSVYTGVDRDLFTMDGIALTDEAARRQNVDVDDYWYYGNIPYEAELALYIIGGIGAASVLGGIAYSLATKGTVLTTYGKTFSSSALTKIAKLNVQGRAVSATLKAQAGQGSGLNLKSTKIDVLKNKAATSFKGTMKGLWYGDLKVCTASYVGGLMLTVGLFVLLLVTTIYFIYNYIVSSQKTYTDIPKVIMNNFSKDVKVLEPDENGKDKWVTRQESIYTRYNAVMDQNGKFADINSNGYEWIVPYVSKDPNAGAPITTDFTFYHNTNNTSSAGFSPMTRIGEKNYYNAHSNSNSNKLYVGYKRDATAYPKTASSFSAGAFTLALCGGIIVGGALGWLGTWLILKKKRKNKLVAEVAQTTQQDN